MLYQRQPYTLTKSRYEDRSIFQRVSKDTMAYGGHCCWVCTACDVTLWRTIHV